MYYISVGVKRTHPSFLPPPLSPPLISALSSPFARGKKVSPNLHRSIRMGTCPSEGSDGSIREAEDGGLGGVNGGEDDVTFTYRRSTPRRRMDSPISLISQPLVGEFPALPSALCPNRPSPWDERHPRY